MAVTAEKEATSAREKLNEDSDDEDEFLEYSPCGTITKLRQQVSFLFSFSQHIIVSLPYGKLNELALKLSIS